MNGRPNGRDHGTSVGHGVGSSCHYAPMRGGEEGASLIQREKDWARLEAYAVLGEAVLQECQRAETVGAIIPATLVGRAVHLGLVAMDDDGMMRILK